MSHPVSTPNRQPPASPRLLPDRGQKPGVEFTVEVKDMARKDVEAIIAEYAQRYEPLIQVEEAAKIAHVPPATIHAWSSAGRMDGFKVRSGRRVLFYRDAFVKLVLGDEAGMEA
jgi:hypothetical protein